MFPIAEEIKLKLRKRYAEDEQIYLEQQVNFCVSFQLPLLIQFLEIRRKRYPFVSPERLAGFSVTSVDPNGSNN